MGPPTTADAGPVNREPFPLEGRVSSSRGTGRALGPIPRPPATSPARSPPPRARRLRA